MKQDIIIIGAGISGLSVGAILAKSGHKVLLLEKNKFIGGRVRVIQKEGFSIDYGLHVNRFAEHSSCAKVLRLLGKKAEFIYLGRPVVFYEDSFWDFPSRPYHFLKVFLTHSKFMSLETKLKFLKIFLSAPFVNPKNFSSKSLFEFLSKYKPTQEILDIASLFCGVAFICPDLNKISALEVGEFFRKALVVRHKHISYLKGGWKKLLDTLKEEIEKNGKILIGNEVKSLKIEDDCVKSVITEKDEYKAECVICTVPFQNIKEIINMNYLSSELQKYTNNVEPTSGVTIDFILSKKISTLSGIIITGQPLTLGYFISNIDKSYTGEKQLGQWYLYLNQDEIKDRSYAKSQINVLKDLLQKMFPNIWDYLVWERPMILDIVDGAVPKVGQGWRERPQFTSNISNLFFAGDSTGGFGWGSEIAFDSAIKCAKIVDEYLKERKEKD